MTGVKGGGGFIGGNTQNFLIRCDGVNFIKPGVTALNTDTEWQYRYPLGVGGNPMSPETADDCARLCGWTQSENGFLALTSTQKCLSWVMSTASGSLKCHMFVDRSQDAVTPTNGALARSSTTAGGFTFTESNVQAAGIWVSGLNQTDPATIVSWKRSVGPENGVLGRYKKDIMMPEDPRDAMKPDLILRAADFPASPIS